jgi:hypothetical protein
MRSIGATALAATLLLTLGGVAAAQASPSPRPIGLAPETIVPAPARTSGPAAAEPVRWEYRTIFVTWDTSILDWVADFTDGNRIQGLDAILNNEGRSGWELVAVVPELWTQVVDSAIREDARRLRLFMKKPLG